MAPTTRPIIIKKVKKAGHAHHGGAWKIAYADFVTAMMAFFLLLWLISMTTPDQKEGLSDYFAPPNISTSWNGSAGTLAGTVVAPNGAKMAGSVIDLEQDRAISGTPSNEDAASTGGGGGATDLGDADKADGQSATELKSMKDQSFHSAAATIRQAWQAMPESAEASDHLILEQTEEGLVIQIVDQQGRPMFPEGSKNPHEFMRAALASIAPALEQLQAPLTISGHTAAGGSYANERYGPWELTMDRANVVRSMLGEFGLSEEWVQSVHGRATAEPFFPTDPYMAANERIEISILQPPLASSRD